MTKVLFCVLLLLLVPFASAQEEAADPSALEVFNQAVEYWNAGNIVGFRSLFADDAQVSDVAFPGATTADELLISITKVQWDGCTVSNVQKIFGADDAKTIIVTFELPDGCTCGATGKKYPNAPHGDYLTVAGGKFTVWHGFSTNRYGAEEALRAKNNKETIQLVAKYWNSGYLGKYAALAAPGAEFVFYGWEDFVPALTSGKTYVVDSTDNLMTFATDLLPYTFTNCQVSDLLEDGDQVAIRLDCLMTNTVNGFKGHNSFYSVWDFNAEGLFTKGIYINKEMPFASDKKSKKDKKDKEEKKDKKDKKEKIDKKAKKDKKEKKNKDEL